MTKQRIQLGLTVDPVDNTRGWNFHDLTIERDEVLAAECEQKVAHWWKRNTSFQIGKWVKPGNRTPTSTRFRAGKIRKI